MSSRLGLIVGGIQKAGTTSLFGYLQDHPSLLAPSVKELHFFDNETLDWLSPNYAFLDQYFPADAAGLRFEITPVYLFWPPALERIRAYNPDIKLIFIFRDPIERAWSQWRMEQVRGSETLPFGAAIRQGRWRLRGISRLDNVWRIHSYVERGFYGQQVKRLLELFPRDNILFLRSDDLKTSHSQVLDRIAAFIGIPPFPDLPERLDHRGEETEERIADEDVDFLRRIFEHEVREFSRLTELQVDDWLTMTNSD